MVMRACALIVLVGLAGVSVANAHSMENAAAAQGLTAADCCHETDHRAPEADCAVSMCCSFSALIGIGARDVPPHSASLGPLAGSGDFASRTPPPILHPPIRF